MSIVAVGGQGLGLQIPFASYNNLGTGNTNRFVLPPCSAFTIPSGTFLVGKGAYSFLQVFDPVSQTWLSRGNDNGGSLQYVNSDGYNYRLANLTGSVAGALVTAGGANYTAATTVVTASAGGASFTPIIGGAISTTVTVGASGGGSGMTLPPMVSIAAPPIGGLPAEGYAVLTSGAVSAIVVTAQGAGYTSPPTFSFLPNQAETSTTAVMPTNITTTLTGTGAITGIIVQSTGSLPLTSIPTLTISGAGTGATATAAMCWTITGVTVGTVGAGVPGSGVAIITAGGYVAGTQAYLNPTFGGIRSVVVQPANIYAPVASGAVGAPVVGYGGLFSGIPIPLIVSNDGAAPTTAPAATIAMGGVPDSVLLQPI